MKESIFAFLIWNLSKVIAGWQRSMCLAGGTVAGKGCQTLACVLVYHARDKSLQLTARQLK